MSKEKQIKIDRDNYVALKGEISLLNRVKYAWQALTRGYSDRDMWEFADWFNKKVIDAFDDFYQFYVENGMYLPEQYMQNPTGWNETLEKIRDAFVIHERIRDGDWSVDEEELKEMKKGYELFGKFLYDIRDLWKIKK